MDIKSAAIKIQEEIVNWRRDLHRIPELSFELHRTAEYLKGHLDKMKIPWKSCAKTGIVALIRGESTGPVIALRADMDALEIREETGLPFAAENGHMHACGHDAHMAILLGAAKIISAHRDKLKGNRFLMASPFLLLIPEIFNKWKVFGKVWRNIR